MAHVSIHGRRQRTDSALELAPEAARVVLGIGSDGQIADAAQR